jgi:Zn finger protein HypA/HybF involved in hydrogenase expression
MKFVVMEHHTMMHDAVSHFSVINLISVFVADLVKCVVKEHLVAMVALLVMV